MISRAIDIKLNVRPICIMLQHQYYYEGPCRFAAGEALTPEFDKLFAIDEKNRFFDCRCLQICWLLHHFWFKKS